MTNHKIAFLVTGIIFAIPAVMIRFFKFYKLISGYLDALEEKKKDFNKDEPARLIGNALVVISAVFLISSLIRFLDFNLHLMIPYIILVAVVVYLVQKLKKFE